MAIDAIKTVDVGVGGVWEGPAWEVHFRVPHQTYTSTLTWDNGQTRVQPAETPCPHVIDYKEGAEKVYPRGEHRNMETVEKPIFWTVPRVVVAYNEAGYNTTGVCLDCIVEWAAAHSLGGE